MGEKNVLLWRLRARQRGKNRKPWKEVVYKDLNDKLSDTVNLSNWKKMIKGHRSDSSSDGMSSAEYESYISGASSSGLTWIKHC